MFIISLKVWPAGFLFSQTKTKGNERCLVPAEALHLPCLQLPQSS